MQTIRVTMTPISRYLFYSHPHIKYANSQIFGNSCSEISFQGHACMKSENCKSYNDSSAQICIIFTAIHISSRSRVTMIPTLRYFFYGYPHVKYENHQSYNDSYAEVSSHGLTYIKYVNDHHNCNYS